jgi:hypothetical protein
VTTWDDLIGWVPNALDVKRNRLQLVQAGAAEFTDGFFHQTIQRLGRGRKLKGQRLGLDELRAMVGGQEPNPQALVFHTGRCGSTLVVRMLAHDRSLVMVSEAGVVGSTHRPMLRGGDSAAQQRLADVLVAFDRYAGARGRRPLYKLSSWQAIDGVALAAMAPDAPVVFLHRAPEEVVASTLDGPPGWAADLFQAPDELATWLPGVDQLDLPYTAIDLYGLIWGAEVRAALAVEDAQPGRVLFVDYDDLRDDAAATLARIAVHCGIAASLPVGAALGESRYYAKSSDPTEEFEPSARHARRPLPAASRDRLLSLLGDTPDLLAHASYSERPR